jgi:DNA-binding response OmpR family regulator
MKQQIFQKTATRGSFAGLVFGLGVLSSSEDRALTADSEWSSGWRKRGGLNREKEILRIGSSLVDRQTGEVETPTGKHRLRQKELDLLMHLFRHAAVTFTREELLQMVWNYQCRLLTRTVDQTIATLRRKIEVSPARPRLIHTVYGIGYRLVL